MEEVDKIIIHTLRDVGCDIDGDIRTIGQFDTNLIIEATVRCLEVIKPDLKLARSLPQNMAARFHMCASIAQACKETGYQGEVGYQTFLYSAGTEIRRVLMFLIDRLPRETEKPILEPQDRLGVLKASLAAVLRDQLGVRLRPPSFSVPFLPHYLHTGVSQPSLPPDHPFNPQEWREYCRNEMPWATQQGPPEQLFSSVVCVLEACRPAERTLSYRPRPRPRTAPRPAPRSTPAPSPSWLSLRSSHQEGGAEEEEKETVEEEQTKERLEEEQTKKEVEECEKSVEEVRLAVQLLREKLNKVREEVRGVEEGQGRGRRAAYLVQEHHGAGPAITHMEAELEASTDRLTHLALHWESVSRPLLDAIRQARRAHLTTHNVHEERLDSMRTMKEQIEDVEKEICSKNLLKTKYETDLAKLPNDITRSVYTRRITEIIGNIKKQKEEIEKVLADMRQVQKEISTVSGRLDRCFTVTDELIFKNAKKDESSRKAYKLLATLHADCADIVALIQETGLIVREISDLHDQIETESGKKVGASLERITVDLEQMRAETNLLKKQLAAGSAD